MSPCPDQEDKKLFLLFPAKSQSPRNIPLKAQEPLADGPCGGACGGGDSLSFCKTASGHSILLGQGPPVTQGPRAVRTKRISWFNIEDGVNGQREGTPASTRLSGEAEQKTILSGRTAAGLLQRAVSLECRSSKLST